MFCMYRCTRTKEIALSLLYIFWGRGAKLMGRIGYFHEDKIKIGDSVNSVNIVQLLKQTHFIDDELLNTGRMAKMLPQGNLTFQVDLHKRDENGQLVFIRLEVLLIEDVEDVGVFLDFDDYQLKQESFIFDE